MCVKRKRMQYKYCKKGFDKMSEMWVYKHMRCVWIEWDVNKKYNIYICVRCNIQIHNIYWDMCVKSYWDVCENTNIQCVKCEVKKNLNAKINIAIQARKYARKWTHYYTIKVWCIVVLWLRCVGLLNTIQT